jgi:NhaP-type Na+/H+ or K+/H+ antiporter
VFLPALVFEASVKIDVRSVLREFLPLFLLVTFGVVIFSILVQGLTMKPFLRKLRISDSNA